MICARLTLYSPAQDTTPAYANAAILGAIPIIQPVEQNSPSLVSPSREYVEDEGNKRHEIDKILPPNQVGFFVVFRCRNRALSPDNFRLQLSRRIELKLR